jgi:hypothetical protein
VVKAVSASTSIPKPSVPEFTVKLINNSYYVPPTTSIDPYTGQTVTQGGYYVEVEPDIEIAIKNQPFTPYVDTATNKGISLFYQVRTKGHFSQDWSIVEYWIKEAPAYNPRNPYPEQDYTSEHTILKYGSLAGQNIPSKGQLDIQVQALIGYVTIHGDPNHSIDLYYQFASFEFTGETSGWSNTQTITISEGQTPTSSPATTPTPTPPNMGPTSPPNHEPLLTPERLGIIMGVAIAAAVIGAGLGFLLYFKKRNQAGIKKHSEIEQPST